jgi:hypothetical protein
MTVAARQNADEASLGEIRRCTVVDMPEWGPWLLGRLREKWPTIGDGSLLGKMVLRARATSSFSSATTSRFFSPS